MATEIKILIADDHPIVRQGLRTMIESAPDLTVIAEAGDGKEALQMLLRLKPQVAVLDIDMPMMDGFSVARVLREKEPGIEIIFLTVHREGSFLDKAMKVGAKGYVLKDSALADIVTGVRAVTAGHSYVSPAMTSYLLNRRDSAKQAGDLTDLTPTELTVLQMIAEYKTTKDIASALFVSPRTVETHRANICQKLNLRGSHALMKYALAQKDSL